MAPSAPDRGRWDDTRQLLLERGYVVLRGLLAPEEVLTLRRAIVRHLHSPHHGIHEGYGKIEPVAAMRLPEVRWLFSDRRVVEALSGLLGVETPVFTFHCDVHRNAFSSWHKDSGEMVMPGGYFGEPTFDLATCAVVKLAVYCEDHRADDAGLHVQPGSHHRSTLDHDQAVGLDTTIGDVVAFDVRITHMGQPEPARFRKLSRYLRYLRALPFDLYGPAGGSVRTTEALRVLGKPDRVSLFFSFGSGGELTSRFAATNWRRAARQTGSAPVPGADLVELLQGAGVPLADLTDAATGGYPPPP